MMSDNENFNYKITNMSLRNLALIEIVAKLWKVCDIMSAVLDESWKFHSKYECLYSTDNFKRLATSISYKITLISSLPPPLAKKAKCFIAPVGLHMCEWIAQNKIYIDLLNLEDFLDSIRWTSRGFIHTSSSIDLWIKKTNLLILFERACQFCVENQIERLWRRLPHFVKRELHRYAFSLEHHVMNYWIYERENNLDIFMELFTSFVEHYTIHVVDGVVPFLHNINFLMIQMSLITANSCAFKYFFSKLSKKERCENAFDYLTEVIHMEINMNNNDHQEYLEIVYYLLPQMRAEERRTILQHYSNFYIYFTGVVWKYQDQLTRTIAMLGNNLNIRMYCNVLVNAVQCVMEGRYIKDGFFEDIWYATPEPFKRNLLQYVSRDTISLLMFEENVVELNELILTETTTAERNKLYSFFEI